MAINRHLRNFTYTDHGVQGRFDADLIIPTNNNNPHDINANAELTLTLKIHLRKIDISIPLDEQGHNVVLRDGCRFTSWPPNKWREFEQMFDLSAGFWNNRFWLALGNGQHNSIAYRAIERDLALLRTADPNQPDAGRRRILQKRVFRRNVNCKFSLRRTSVGEAHRTLDAYYIVDREGNQIENPYIFRSSDTRVDVGDVYTDGLGHDVMAHEVGHLLGLAHIGVITGYEPCMRALEATTPNPNADVCYEGPTVQDTNNIMGRGNLLTYHQALPWRKAFQAMTGVPYSSYVVHQHAVIPLGFGSELIREGTARWRDFVER